MLVRLIALDKQPGVRLVGIGETWRCLFANIMLKITRIEAIMACQDDQLRTGLKSGVDGAIHGVQDIWYENSTTKDWRLLLLDADNAF